ncbi:VPS24 [Lepeophtheirus salmonis]|uniref:VPS24 n=1 Tax=Lepeophtheirus salmonis TaxID=72036 RepID=A0A7R8CDZ5_LEPSM|nr:VPS24 [Lepeophtheirus salmonis]CAF2791251.1 VPS24 [Lepeophtheirus salmonis]
MIGDKKKKSSITIMGLFGRSKSPNPKERVNEWGKKLRKEGYNLDRQIRQIQREEAKVTRSIKESAKRGDKDSCRVLAREVVNSRKTVNKIYVAKANLSSVEMQMKNQASQVRLAGTLSQSTEVMQCMQKLIKLPEIAHTMQELSKEMMKAGIFEEMMEDTFDNEPEELEDDVQKEVDKVLAELTEGDRKTMEKAPSVPQASIDIPEKEESDGEEEELQERLEALKSY